MSRAKRVQLSVKELVAYIKRTKVPTVLVEGTDDHSVYRYLEERLGDLGVDVLICDGRENLLRVFERDAEFLTVPVAYLADRDMWLFVGIPSEYRHKIIFTSGYSIENDLYNRSLFEGLLTPSEKTKFQALLGELCRWFGFEVERFRRDHITRCDAHISRIIPRDTLDSSFLSQVGYWEPETEGVEMLLHNYRSHLRGKTLFQALLRFLSDSNRQSKYSTENLLELGARFGEESTTRLHAEITSALSMRTTVENWVVIS